MSDEVKTYTFPFTDRDSYLKWRAEWRQNYADLIKQIRAAKRSRKQFLWGKPEGAVRGPNKTWKRIKLGPNPDHGKVASWSLDGLQQQARDMCEERRQSKLRAAELREAMKKAA